MPQTLVEGLYTAIVTPFTDRDELDEKGLRKLLQYQVQGGVDGINLLGATGEGALVTDEERCRMIAIAAEELDGKIPLMVHVGTNSTKTTVERAREAEKLGAKSLLIVTPYYVKPTQEGIYQHFKAVAAEVSIPICVYNIASRSGVNIETSTLLRLASIKNIQSVKESSCNLMQMSDVIEKICPQFPDFRVLSGDDSFTFSLIALGGHGAISVISNLLPRFTKLLIDTARANPIEARKLHFQLRYAMQMIFIETNPIPIKRLLALHQLPAGRCRSPLSDLMPENDLKMKQTYSALHELLQQEILLGQQVQKMQEVYA